MRSIKTPNDSSQLHHYPMWFTSVGYIEHYYRLSGTICPNKNILYYMILGKNHRLYGINYERKKEAQVGPLYNQFNVNNKSLGPFKFEKYDSF